MIKYALKDTPHFMSAMYILTILSSGPIKNLGDTTS